MYKLIKSFFNLYKYFFIIFSDLKVMWEQLPNFVLSVIHLLKDFKTKVLSFHGVKFVVISTMQTKIVWTNLVLFLKNNFFVFLYLTYMFYRFVFIPITN